jgi:hypothetical protein
MSDAMTVTLWHVESGATSLASIVPGREGRKARLALTEVNQVGTVSDQDAYFRRWLATRQR